MEDKLQNEISKARSLQVLLSHGSTFEVRESINPMPNVEKPERSELQETTIVTPPPTKYPPGRPKLKVVESVDIIKLQLQCSKCKVLAHNKKTCK
ncbi:hypothetical protein BUALT_Bualt04G0000300 [Buddleja alternifolia]|uniref:Uncharacterized protein n=1 Tax=Buddleja alternifolia TaxID=168488 RepID=A0AAV6XJW6_9LAMI|nr:hypothetical protein BUALT_Bualt04G0000300 [Buddleja alternifolia]